MVVQRRDGPGWLRELEDDDDDDDDNITNNQKMPLLPSMLILMPSKLDRGQIKYASQLLPDETKFWASLGRPYTGRPFAEK